MLFYNDVLSGDSFNPPSGMLVPIEMRGGRWRSVRSDEGSEDEYDRHLYTCTDSEESSDDDDSGIAQQLV